LTSNLFIIAALTSNLFYGFSGRPRSSAFILSWLPRLQKLLQYFEHIPMKMKSCC